MPGMPGVEGYGMVGRVTDVALEQERALSDQLAQALRLTQEYVGNELLPALPGWSWFDALEAYKAARATPADLVRAKSSGEVVDAEDLSSSGGDRPDGGGASDSSEVDHWEGRA